MWQDKSDIKVGLFYLFNVQVLGILWVLASEWRTLTNLTPSISRFIHNSIPPSYKPTSFDKFLTTKEVKITSFSVLLFMPLLTPIMKCRNWNLFSSGLWRVVQFNNLGHKRVSEFWHSPASVVWRGGCIHHLLQGGLLKLQTIQI